jgi:uncharacterized sulfatase
VNVWPDDPHTPVEPSPARRGDGSNATAYRAVVEELDRDLGALIDFIRADAALRENTLIVFASDNGPEEGFGSTGGFRGAKTNLYEGGIRVPLIVWGPGLIPGNAAGTTDAQSVILGMDFAPTLLALAGVSAGHPDFDGQDLSQAWLGRPVTAPRTVVWTRPPDQPGRNHEMPDVAVRRADWKLLLYDDGRPPELYDLAADSREAKNRAGQRPEIVSELRMAVGAWRSKVLP